MKRIALFIFLICFCLSSVLLAVESREPETTLKQALAKAEQYVEKKQLDTSDLFLMSVWRSENAKHPKQNCWTVIWAPKGPSILDGELRVYIYDDGRIEHGGSA